MDAFIQKLSSKSVHERLCTEPKGDPREAFMFAVAYEEETQQHKAHEGENTEKYENKQERVLVVDEKETHAPVVALILQRIT